MTTVKTRAGRNLCFSQDEQFITPLQLIWTFYPRSCITDFWVAANSLEICIFYISELIKEIFLLATVLQISQLWRKKKTKNTWNRRWDCSDTSKLSPLALHAVCTKHIYSVAEQACISQHWKEACTLYTPSTLLKNISIFPKYFLGTQPGFLSKWLTHWESGILLRGTLACLLEFSYSHRNIFNYGAYSLHFILCFA